jgi:hypothetical protein
VYLTGRLIVDSVVVGLGIALLVAIAVRRHRRCDAEGGEGEQYDGPEPTEAEVEAAEQSIRSKATESVQQAKAKAVKGLMVLLLFVLASAPFMAGMPLNRAFRPWGQLLLFCCVLAFAWAMMVCLGLVFAWSFKKNAEKLLASLHDSD